MRPVGIAIFREMGSICKKTPRFLPSSPTSAHNLCSQGLAAGAWDVLAVITNIFHIPSFYQHLPIPRTFLFSKMFNSKKQNNVLSPESQSLSCRLTPRSSYSVDLLERSGCFCFLPFFRPPSSSDSTPSCSPSDGATRAPPRGLWNRKASL